MKEKIIVLNSGGFDSVTMLHSLHSQDKYEIHTLFFDYHQANLKQELKCFKDSCTKVGIDSDHSHIIKLPDFNSQSGTMYIEMRNLVFLAHAVSLAERIGATSIALAYIDTDDSYKDTSKEFVDNTRKYLKTLGIYLMTPFFDLCKIQVGYIARTYDIKETDYFSCNTPIKGKPCGECGDCTHLDYIEPRILNNFTPKQEFTQNGMTETFEELYLNQQVEEIQITLNAYYDYWVDLCKQAIEKGIKTITFKPTHYILIGSVLHLMKEFAMCNVKFNLVLPEYNVDYEEYINHFSQFNKVPNLGVIKLECNPPIIKGSNSIFDIFTNKDLEININITPYNYKHIGDFISEVNSDKDSIVNKFNITVKEGFDDISVDLLDELYHEIKYLKLNSKARINFRLPLEMAEMYSEVYNMPENAELDSDLCRDIERTLDSSSMMINKNLNLDVEVFDENYSTIIPINNECLLANSSLPLYKSDIMDEIFKARHEFLDFYMQ